MTKESLLKLIQKRKDRCESWTRLADQLNVTPQYLQDVKDGRREPGAKILNALGLEKVISYKAIRGIVK